MGVGGELGRKTGRGWRVDVPKNVARCGKAAEPANNSKLQRGRVAEGGGWWGWGRKVMLCAGGGGGRAAAMGICPNCQGYYYYYKNHAFSNPNKMAGKYSKVKGHVNGNGGVMNAWESS